MGHMKTGHQPCLILSDGAGSVPLWVIAHHGRRIYTGARNEQLDEAVGELKLYASGCRLKKDWEPTWHRPRGLVDVSIYFISSDEVPAFPIKIGQTDGGLSDRVAALQCGCPYRLMVMGSFLRAPEAERLLHIEFAHLRMGGEWFRRSPELLSRIAELDERAAAA